MTPQLMQAIKLLQLSNLDLAAYVDAELERNPLLERETEGDGERLEPEVAGMAGRRRRGRAARTGRRRSWIPAARRSRNGSIPISTMCFPLTKAGRPAPAAAPELAGLFGMGRRARWPRGRRV